MKGWIAKPGVAIDGSKFKAVNNRDKNFTRAKMERRLAQIEESVARYLSQLDTADLQEPSETLAVRTAHLKDKLAKLASEVERLKAIEEEMLISPDQQISLTDPDSRSMATSGRGSGVVGYNMQVAVDTEHHLIVTHEVTNSGSDRSQLANMARQAKADLGADHLDAVADRGCFNSPEILACEQGAGDERRRHVQANRLRHDQVNDEVELSGRLDRKIGGFRPSKILSDQVAGAPPKSMKATVPPGIENSYFS